jgi:uroporphyrinogen decarboxylase
MAALPLKNPRPDAKLFIDILMGRRKAPPPLVEYIVDDVLMRPISEELLGRAWVPEGEQASGALRGASAGRDQQKAYLDTFIEFWRRMGYDFIRYERGLDFPERKLEMADTAPGSSKKRAWADQHVGGIMSWEDFERYPWPRIEDFDFFPFEYIDSHLPEGMGLLTCHAGGIYEHLSWIMSYERLCIALHDDPALVKAVADRIGGLLVGFYEHLLGLDRVIAIFQGDDMGFKTGTLLSPEALKTYCLPWQRKLAALAHGKGLPYFLHSCGNLLGIMEDLIEDVGIDGKHSFEDAIMPVQEFQRRFGERVAVLGGLDINILAGASPEEVRRRTGILMEECGARGRYAIGSGNSVPSYVPVPNYLAMVGEAAARRGLKS